MTLSYVSGFCGCGHILVILVISHKSVSSSAPYFPVKFYRHSNQTSYEASAGFQCSASSDDWEGRMECTQIILKPVRKSIHVLSRKSRTLGRLCVHVYMDGR